MSPTLSPDLVRLVQAASIHVAFDGWSDTTLAAAAADCGMDLAAARALAPRGGVDLAAAAHKLGDDVFRDSFAAQDLTGLRLREKIALAMRLRLATAGDRDGVRAATTLFALPHHAPQAAVLMWGTADAIWTAVGDTATDGNYYSKRATLSAIWGAVVLYWLGDESEDYADTHAFIDRRIADVMAFEGAKAKLRASPLFGPLTAPLGRMMAAIKAPAARDDLPGRWTNPAGDAGSDTPPKDTTPYA